MNFKRNLFEIEVKESLFEVDVLFPDQNSYQKRLLLIDSKGLYFYQNRRKFISNKNLNDEFFLLMKTDFI